MASPTTRKSGSEYGRYTFHLPNGYTRRPMDDDDASSRAGLYQPLLADENVDTAADAEAEAGFGSTEGRDRRLLEGVESWEEHPSLNKLTKSGVLLAFGLMGAAVLLPFNTLITPTEYYRVLLASSSVPKSFMSWVLLVYNVATIAFGAHATVSLQKTTPARRIYRSSAAIFLCLLLFTLFAMRAPIPDKSQAGSTANGYFGVLMLFAFIIATSTAYLQNAVVSLCSLFGGRSMGLMLTGQGLVGLVISIVQLLAAYRNSYHAAARLASNTAASSSSSSLHTDTPSEDEEASTTAAVFFAFSTTFLAVATTSFIWLARLRVYRSTVQGYEAAKKQTEIPPQEPSVPTEEDDGRLGSLIRSLVPAKGRQQAQQILAVQRKVQTLSICIFGVFAVTLSSFPALTARVSSTHSTKVGWTSPLLFVAWHFVLFNASDLLGRSLPAISPNWTLRSTKLIVVSVFLRLLFIPAFLACNLRPSIEGSATSTLLAALPDWAFFGLITLFGLSNGLVATSIMVGGPSSPLLQNDSERAMAGAVLSFWLTLGLAAGSISSFALVALV